MFDETDRRNADLKIPVNIRRYSNIIRYFNNIIVSADLKSVTMLESSAGVNARLCSTIGKSGTRKSKVLNSHQNVPRVYRHCSLIVFADSGYFISLESSREGQVMFDETDRQIENLKTGNVRISIRISHIYNRI